MKPIARCAILLSLLTSAASAADPAPQTWIGGGAGNDWTTAGNWSSSNVPNTITEAALLTNDPVGQTKLSPNLPADVTIGQLQFSATAPSYNITGTGTATLFLNPVNFTGAIGITIAAGAANQTISAAEVEFLSTQTWTINGTATLLVTSTIEDDSMIDYGLTKNGTGTLNFPGDVRYDGPTIINAGTMILSSTNSSMLSSLTINGGVLRGTTKAGALGTSSSRNTITLAGGALELANDTALTFGSASRNTNVTANSTIRSDRLTLGAGVTHTLGTLSIGAQTLTIAPGSFVNGGTAGISFGGTALSSNGAAFDIATGASLTLGALSGNFTFTKQGDGLLTLSAASNANRTSARVTLSAGTLKLSTASALGTSAVPITLSGGTLDLAANTTVNAHAVTVSGNSTIVSNRSSAGAGVSHVFGTLQIGSHTLAITKGANVNTGTAGITFGNVTLTGNATFDAGAGTQLTLGALSNSGGNSLTFQGAGPITIGNLDAAAGTTAAQLSSIGTTTIAGDAFLTATRVRGQNLNIGSAATIAGAKLVIKESSPTYAQQPQNPAGSDSMLSIVRNITLAQNAGSFLGTLDLTNNDLIIDYTGGASPLADIEAMVKSGYSNGTWTGKGITSSVAALNPSLFHLAVADNAQLGGTAFDSFDGVNTSSHQQIIVKFTWIADINLDGLVNANDAIAFATFYSEGQTGAHHQFGDFNYDGVIDTNDAILFSTAYNESLPHMPEPASLGILVLGSLTLLCRRKRV
jgi:autotransporter-associated beta strand protein